MTDLPWDHYYYRNPYLYTAHKDDALNSFRIPDVMKSNI